MTSYMNSIDEIKKLLYSTFKVSHDVAFSSVPINWPNLSIVDVESLRNPFVSIQVVFKSPTEMLGIGGADDIIRGELLVSYLCPANTGFKGSGAYSDMLRQQFCFQKVNGIVFKGIQVLEVSPAPGIVGQMNVIPFMV